jgi:hypothetical protein
MAPGLAVRLTLLWVCLLATWSTSVARADGSRAAASGGSFHVALTDGQLRTARRPIAVIDLANDPQVRDVAYKLLDLLASHVELAPPAISDGAALVDKLPPDDDLGLIDAQRKRMAAEQNLAQRNFREAAIAATEGQEILLHVAPQTAISTYADLALALGQSRLGEKRDAEALAAFSLVYRLDPRRTLDDLHYLPEVVKMFESVKQAGPELGTIAVRGTGRAWIDGVEVGTAPGEFQVALGRHVVWLTGLLRDTDGTEVTVVAGKSAVATIEDGPLTRPQKVARFRAALSQARDAGERASAMAALAAFVNVHEAVLLSLQNGQIVWQIWRDRALGFSALRELGHEPPIEILNQIAPPHPQPDADQPLPVAPEKRWYHQTRFQLGMAAAAVAAIVGAYLYVHYYTEPARAWNSDVEGFSK